MGMGCMYRGMEYGNGIMYRGMEYGNGMYVYNNLSMKTGRT